MWKHTQKTHTSTWVQQAQFWKHEGCTRTLSGWLSRLRNVWDVTPSSWWVIQRPVYQNNLVKRVTNLADCNVLCNGNKLEAVTCRGNKTLARKELKPNLLQATQNKQIQKINNNKTEAKLSTKPCLALFPNKHYHFRILLTEHNHVTM